MGSARLSELSSVDPPHKEFLTARAPPSIVLLHGLNAHWLDCYTDRETGVCWLRDLLPQDISGTPYRLLSYGYDTSVVETKPMEHVVHDFLRRLSNLREDTEVSKDRREDLNF